MASFSNAFSYLQKIGKCMMLAVTAGAFMLVAWSATKALLVFLQKSPIPC